MDRPAPWLSLVAIVLLGALFCSGCATQYQSPYAQEESPGYRNLYQPFSSEPDPASGSGDSSGSWD